MGERSRSPGGIGASDVEFTKKSARQFRSGAPLCSALVAAADFWIALKSVAIP